ncbi:MAG: response regulator transcription factor [Flavobacteriales bacterium]|nr:response regulator transcription factor [Flavobacteriales bacterium]MDG1765323.1 response regulator transcription factor [Flavobacteriales bacterium]
MNEVDLKYRVLLVEDELALRKAITLNLEMEGYEVVAIDNGPDGLEALRNQRFDMVLLDVMLPGIDGFTICKTVRLEGNKTPIMFLTAKNTGPERVEGLKLGADDYLSKPFHLEELLVRVSKLISRKDTRQQSLASIEVFEFGPCKVNFKTYSIIDKDGEERALSKKEIMLLKLLIQKKDEVVSREEILESIWGYDVFPSTRTIDNYILAFRKYFEPNPRQPQHFFSVRGVGYKFSP